MKIYCIKHKGANNLMNFITTGGTMELVDKDKFYYMYMFLRKKDAKKYLQTFSYPEFFEVVGCTVDETTQDNRKTR